MALFVLSEVNGLVDFVDDLAQEDAILHVVVGIGECRLDDDLGQWSVRPHLKIGERFEEIVVNEIEQLGASGRLAVAVINSPAVPAQSFGDYRLVRIVVELPFFFFGIIDFEEEQPGHLLDALGIAVDACIFSHDVLQGLYKGSESHSGFLP